MSSISTMFEEIRKSLDQSREYVAFAERHNVRSASILTVTDAEDDVALADRIEARIRGKVVVEIGTGIGLLALCMITVAHQVFAIEANPIWALTFTQLLVDVKPKNVSFILGSADEFIGVIKADVAVIATHSDVKGMKALGGQLAKETIDIYGELIEANPEAFDAVARKLRRFA